QQRVVGEALNGDRRVWVVVIEKYAVRMEVGIERILPDLIAKALRIAALHPDVAPSARVLHAPHDPAKRGTQVVPQVCRLQDLAATNSVAVPRQQIAPL